MRRALVALALSLVAGLVPAGPATADDAVWPVDCVDFSAFPRLWTAYFEDGRLIVNPEGAPGDADALASWAPGFALDIYRCVLGPLPLDPVFCTYDAAREVDPTRYVYPNPNGPGYVVDIPQIEADVRSVLDCHLAT